MQAADLPGLTADLKRTSAALRDTVQGEQMQKLLANAALAADRLANAAARLPPLIASLQATAQRAGNGTADLEQGLVPLLRDMQATAQNLREMTEALRRYPAQVSAASRRRAAGAGTMRRRLVLAGRARRWAGVRCCRRRPYVQRRDWPLDVRRGRSLPPRRRGRVLLVRSMRAGPGLEVRGLQWLQRDGSVHVDFYEQWAVPPAQAVEDDLRQWLADCGAVQRGGGAGQPAERRFRAGGRTGRVRGRSEHWRGAGGTGAGAAGPAAQSDQGAAAEDRDARR